jgi:hypothetical protein
MASNTAPIFTGKPQINWGTISAANTAKDGTGTVVTVFTANATNGGYVAMLVARALGTNVVTVMRVFVNNGSTNTTAANNSLIYEITLPATTLSEVAQLAAIDLPIQFPLPAGYKINVTLGTAVSAGYQVTVIGGDYTPS